MWHLHPSLKSHCFIYNSQLRSFTDKVSSRRLLRSFRHHAAFVCIHSPVSATPPSFLGKVLSRTLLFEINLSTEAKTICPSRCYTTLLHESLCLDLSNTLLMYAIELHWTFVYCQINGVVYRKNWRNITLALGIIVYDEKEKSQNVRRGSKTMHS